MIKKLFPLLLFFGLTLQVEAQKNKILKTFVEICQLVNQATEGLQDLGTTNIEINSASKAYFGGGHTRGAVQIKLPKGTEKWFFRITVMDIKQNYAYQNNESFYYILKNNLSDNVYQPTTDGIDFFLLQTSGDVASFLQTGNNNFNYIPASSYLNTNSFYGACDIVQDNLWIGSRNNNKVQGLKV